MRPALPAQPCPSQGQHTDQHAVLPLRLPQPLRLSRRPLLWAGLAWAWGGAPGVASAQATLPDIVARSKPAVVAIGTHSPLSSPRFVFRGTGFVVGDGLTVVTNAHVLPPPGGDGAASAAAGLPAVPGTPPPAAPTPALPTPVPAGSNLKPPELALHVPGSRKSSSEPGDIRTLTLVGLDREHDLAVLRFTGAPLPTLPLAAADTAREGQAVALIGFPLGGTQGFSHVTHRGIVSAITPIVLPPAVAGQLDPRAVARVRQGVFDILQLDATAYPGNSGGPVLDAETGQVLGVVNMVLVKGTRESALSAPTGISYAIPVTWLHALLGRR